MKKSISARTTRTSQRLRERYILLVALVACALVVDFLPALMDKGASHEGAQREEGGRLQRARVANETTTLAAVMAPSGDGEFAQTPVTQMSDLQTRCTCGEG